MGEVFQEYRQTLPFYKQSSTVKLKLLKNYFPRPIFCQTYRPSKIMDDWHGHKYTASEEREYDENLNRAKRMCREISNIREIIRGRDDHIAKRAKRITTLIEDHVLKYLDDVIDTKRPVHEVALYDFESGLRETYDAVTTPPIPVKKTPSAVENKSPPTKGPLRPAERGSGNDARTPETSSSPISKLENSEYDRSRTSYSKGLSSQKPSQSNIKDKNKEAAGPSTKTRKVLVRRKK